MEGKDEAAWYGHGVLQEGRFLKKGFGSEQDPKSGSLLLETVVICNANISMFSSLMPNPFSSALVSKLVSK